MSLSFYVSIVYMLCIIYPVHEHIRIIIYKYII
jgi:hypothetical protein